jgi:hypothetical protein
VDDTESHPSGKLAAETLRDIAEHVRALAALCEDAGTAERLGALAEKLEKLNTEAKQSGDEVRKRIIDREFPYQVAIEDPTKRGVEILRMNGFCRENRFPFAFRADRNEGTNVAWYCFTDRAHADAFVLKFPGKTRYPTR